MVNRLKNFGIAASIFGCLAAVPATAQPRDIALQEGETWEHDWTEMEFPTRIGTFERTRLSAFEDRQTNIAANYFEDATNTYLTIYAYRPGNPVAPIWFDRALVAIGVRSAETYGRVDLDDLKIGTFVPTGGSVESGQYAVTKVDGRFRSTAAAIYQAGEWLIKVRISSQRLNVDEMETLAKSTLAGLPAMGDVSAAPAYFVEECDGPAASNSATPVDRNGDDAMALQIMMAGLLTLDDGTGSARYCREGGRDAQFNVFRPAKREDGFIIAIGDAGSSVEVFSVGEFAGLGMPTPENLYAVRSATGTDVTLYTPFSGMPNLEQVAQSFGGSPIAKSTRPLAPDEKAETNVYVGQPE